MKKKLKTNKTKIAQIKYQALQLRTNKQLPFYLVKLINELTGDEPIQYVQWLLQMSKHFMRLKGYYKDFPEAEKIAEDQLKESRLKLGF